MNRIFLSIFLLCCTFIAEAQQRYFEIEVRQPARVQLPDNQPEVSRLLVVNNAAFQPDSFGHRNKRNDEETGSTNIDLQTAGRQCVFGALEALEQTEQYEEVSVLDKPLNPKKSFFKRTPLTSSVADSLMTFYGCDALLSLNQLVLYDVLESYETESGTFYAYLQAYVTTQWSIHYIGQKNSFVFAISDTLLWAKEDASEVTALMALPDRQTALIDFAFYAGNESAKALYPQWTTEERYLYHAASKDMDVALQYFTKQQWQAAFEAWQQIALNPTESQLLRAYSYADMALAAEMMGDFDAAIQCVDEAVSLFAKLHTSDALQQKVNILYYRSQLLSRKKAL